MSYVRSDLKSYLPQQCLLLSQQLLLQAVLHLKEEQGPEGGAEGKRGEEEGVENLLLSHQMATQASVS